MEDVARTEDGVVEIAVARVGSVVVEELGRWEVGDVVVGEIARDAADGVVDGGIG